MARLKVNKEKERETKETKQKKRFREKQVLYLLRLAWGSAKRSGLEDQRCAQNTEIQHTETQHTETQRHTTEHRDKEHGVEGRVLEGLLSPVPCVGECNEVRYKGLDAAARMRSGREQR